MRCGSRPHSPSDSTPATPSRSLSPHTRPEILLLPLTEDLEAEGRRLDTIAGAVCFQDVKDAAQALKPMAAVLQQLAARPDADSTAQLEAVISTLIHNAVLLEARLHRSFTAALGEVPRRSDPRLRDRLVSLIRRGRADLGRLYSSWLWGSAMFEPYVLQTNGGFPMAPALAGKLMEDFGGDRAKMQGDMILRSLLPTGEQPRRIATLQEVSEASLAHVVAAENLRGYAAKTTEPDVTYTYRRDTQTNTAVLLKGPPPEVLPDFMASLSEAGDVADVVDRLFRPDARSVTVAVRETLRSARMLAVRSGTETIVTAHFPSISTIEGANRNIRAYLAIIVMLRARGAAEGGRLIFNADANLPVTGTISDKVTGADHDPGLSEVLARIDGVTFWYAEAMPKRRSESMLDNQQAIAKGGVGVARSTMISATIGPPPPEAPPRNPQQGRPLLTDDNTTDHQIIDTGESITMNCGYTGGDESSTLLHGRLDRRSRLKQAGCWEELEALMQASVVKIAQDMAPLIASLMG